MAAIKKINLNTLVYDPGVYPRHDVNRQNIASIKEAYINETPLPALVACKKTKVIIDGRHRHIAILEIDGVNAEHEVQFETFRTKKDRLRRAMQLNCNHGLKLSRYDLSRCVILGHECGLSEKDIADSIGVRIAYIESITQDRLAKVNGAENVLHGKPNPLKRSIRHLAGKKLTDAQKEANVGLSGWSPLFHANQLIRFIENDFLQEDNEPTIAALRRLSELLDTLLTSK